MEAEFWYERWQAGTTPWGQPNPHPVLVAEWARHVDGAGGVLVPLCGTSVDMDWLSQQGHRVVGVELSPVAVAQYFDERKLDPEVRTVGSLTVHRAGDVELWCGDIFDLPATALNGVTSVYDRASLVALPPSTRAGYAAHLTSILPAGAGMFLLAFEYDDSEMDGPPFSVTRDEIADLYRSAFDIEVVVDDDVLDRHPDLAARGLGSLRETLTILRRHT